jgi:carbonic anhydrase
MSNKLCSEGQFQSPIDIKSNSVIQCATKCNLIFYYRTSKCSIVNIGNDIIMEYDTGSYVTYNSVVYELLKISFSIPSSHNIDGYSYPAEMLIFHRSADTGELLVLSVFLDVNDAMSKSNMFFEMFSNSIPTKKGQTSTINTSDDWNVFNAIPETKSFYYYKGSLVRSPCTENVSWIVLDTAVNCSTNFFDKLKGILGNNARKIQKTNGRQVYYNSNTAQANTRNYGDKLRCYTENEFRESCSKLSANPEIISSKNKQALILLLLVLGIIAFVLAILYFHQQGMLNNIGDRVKNFFEAPVLNRPNIPNIPNIPKPVPQIRI